MSRTAPPLPRLGKYELKGELGRGAMGVVYEAVDQVLHRDVALKTMTAPLSGKVGTVRFLREARTAGKLHHPNIVTIHELGHDSGTYFIAMEMLKGRTLYDLIGSGQLPPVARRLEIIARICDGLDYAHRAGIVHRDIKPANVFLVKTGTVKILDFGIAKIAASDTTRTGIVMGTVDYMPPEQVRAVKNIDGRADIFSAGVILYELLFQRKPFAADDIGAALHRILHEQPPGWTMFDRIFPAELAGVLRRSMDKRREARFNTAAEMAQQLDRVAAALGGRAGIELEERIDEVIASRLLDKRETAPPGEPQCVDGETMELSSSGDRSPAARTKLTPTRRSTVGPMALAAAIVLLITAAFFFWRASDRPGSTASATQPASIDAPAPATRTPATTPAPAAAPPAEPEVVTENRTPEPEPAQPETVAVPVEPDPIPAAPLPRGRLDVLVMPWANIEWIENIETGERLPSDITTPARLELPIGRYRLHLVNPYVAAPLDVETTVRAGEIGEIRRSIADLDAAELAAEILTREAATGRTR